MTLNCPVDNQGKPLALSQEIFFLYRPHIEFQIKIEGVGWKKCKGVGFLTTFRLIFVPYQPSKYFLSFDVPIHLLYDEGAEFPLFGATYLYGSCLPYQNLLPGKSHFKLWFKEGGCDTFIRLLDRLIKQNRNSRSKKVAFENTTFYQDMRSGKFNFNAFVNPNDPSKIITQQKQN